MIGKQDWKAPTKMGITNWKLQSELHTWIGWMKNDWLVKTSSAVKCSSQGNKRSVWHCRVHWKKSVERRFFCKKFSYDGGLEIKGPTPRRWNFAPKCFKPRIQSWWNLSIPTFREGRKAPSEIHQHYYFFFSQRNITSILCFLVGISWFQLCFFGFPHESSVVPNTHGVVARCRRLSCANPVRSSKQNCGKLNWSNVKHWQR